MQSRINKDKSSGKNQNLHAYDFIRIQYEIPLENQNRTTPTLIY